MTIEYKITSFSKKTGATQELEKKVWNDSALDFFPTVQK